jgi:hypothetical protein
MLDVARDEAESVLLGGGGDDEVGVPLGLARSVGFRPEVGGAIKYVVGDGQNKRVLTECGEALELASRAFAFSPRTIS